PRSTLFPYTTLFRSSQEIALFAKDDFKVTKRLTLNLGVRWDFFGSPYFEGGVTSIFKDGYGAFGATRSASGSIDDFNSDPFSYLDRKSTRLNSSHSQ